MTRLVMLLKGWCVTGVLAAICNYIYTLRMNNPAKVVTPFEAAPGLLLMLGMIIASQLCHKLMQRIAPSVKAPVVLYITLIGILITAPGLFPFSGFVYKSIGKISLLPLCTPIPAYAGIGGGKDLKTFKEQGIAIIAQLVMKGTGVI